MDDRLRERRLTKYRGGITVPERAGGMARTAFDQRAAMWHVFELAPSVFRRRISKCHLSRSVEGGFKARRSGDDGC